MLGYGFPMRSLKAALEHGFDVIALDAGSVDPGPYYLGTGKSFTSRTMVKRDLKLIVEAGQTAHVPILIGTACGSGATPHLDWAMRILDEIVEELDIHPKVARIDALRASAVQRRNATVDGPHQRDDQQVRSLHQCGERGTESGIAGLRGTSPL